MRPRRGQDGTVDDTVGARATASPAGAPVKMNGNHAAVVLAPQRGGKRTTSATTPLPRKSQTISDSVQAVATALAVNSAHSRRSRAIVIRTSLTALRAMMAMTAAPTP